MPAARPYFPPACVKFLRALGRNNDRDWFRERKEEFDRDVRGPMSAVVEQLDYDFRGFAPELIASPKISIFRIYRDTRFSEDKAPLKTHISAVFPHRTIGKNGGASLYFEVNPKTVLIAGGMYTPRSPELRAVRQHIALNLARFRSIVEAPGFERDAGGLHGDTLTRMPLGFSVDHPGAQYLRMKQFLFWRELPVAEASVPTFYPKLLKIFRAGAPMVRFLNEALVPGAAR